ncbi:MAG: FtsH protease activity modulator HflK [Verrucomicrobia bacterium]|nr:MAG: FtsH protease activity modulator HflK [Verrucomicrobiota bacterium]
MKPPIFHDIPAPGLPNFKLPAKLILLVPLALLVLMTVFSGYFTVDTESVAIVQRFGKFERIAEPGLHFKLPLGIDQATVIPIQRQLQLEFGFGTPNATNPDQVGSEPQLERDMVTGDLNAAEVEWILQYSISDPIQYLFHVRNAGPTLRDLTESVMCEIIGDRTIDEVLTIGRAEIEKDCLEKLRTLLERFNMGISAKQLQLNNVHPPGPVQRSFDEVNRAQQERETLINEANGEYNRIIPKAKGLAAQRISAAEGFAFQRVNEAEGDVTRFKQLLVQYEKAPAITKQRLYLETMNEVLPKVGSKIILDEGAKQFLPLMNLQPASSATPPPTR